MRSIADVFPVVATTRTKSIQKQIKSKYPEVGSEKPLASKTCFFLNSSFLDLISKQTRLTAAGSAFLF